MSLDVVHHSDQRVVELEPTNSNPLNTEEGGYQEDTESTEGATRNKHVDRDLL